MQHASLKYEGIFLSTTLLIRCNKINSNSLILSNNQSIFKFPQLSPQNIELFMSLHVVLTQGQSDLI